MSLKAKAKDLTFKAKAKAKDLSFKAKDLTSEHVQGPSRTALDYGVRENIKLRKSNSTVAHVHAINTLFVEHSRVIHAMKVLFNIVAVLLV